MKAYVLEGINNLQYKEVERPVPGTGEVLVRVRNMGVCGSDIPRIYKTGAHKSPLIVGHEFAGEVVEMDSSCQQDWTGKPVGIFPLIPCRTCPQCQKKQYEMCQNYNYLGSRCDGGFGEYVKVPEWNLLELPESVSFEDVAMLEPTAVAAHAMRAMEVKTDDVVCVCGMGTIGLLLVMLLKEAGVKKVLAVANKDLQKQLLLELEVVAEDICDARVSEAGQWLQAKTGGCGVDVFFECVGTQATLVEAIDNAAFSGRVMLVGNPYGDMELPKDVYWKILRRQLTIKGTWNSSYTGEASDDWHYVLEKIASGRIAPHTLISHRFPLEDAEKGLHIMRDKSEEYVKVMVEM